MKVRERAPSRRARDEGVAVDIEVGDASDWPRRIPTSPRPSSGSRGGPRQSPDIGPTRLVLLSIAGPNATCRMCWFGGAVAYDVASAYSAGSRLKAPESTSSNQNR